MDDADTLSYATDDIDQRLMDSPRSVASEQTVDYPGSTAAIDVDEGRQVRGADAEGADGPSLLYGVALRSDVMRQLQRNPSVVLDDGQLAVYLQFRGVALPAVVEWGVFYYLEQHEPEYDLFRREITQQIQSTVAAMDYLGVLTFFRFMLEGEYLEAFYTAVYQLVIDRIRSAERVSYFADVLHPLPVSAEDDALTPTEPDTDSTSEQGSVPAVGAASDAALVIDVLDDSEDDREPEV